MTPCRRIPPYLIVPPTDIKDISDVALDKRLSRLEQLLSGGSVSGGSTEGGETSVETTIKIQMLQKEVQTLQEEIARQARKDEEHDAHMDAAEQTAKDIEAILDKING